MTSRLADDQPIRLTDEPGDQSAITTKWAARQIIESWYGALAKHAEPAEVAHQLRTEMDRVADGIEQSDLSGSDYLGLRIDLADAD